MKHFFRKSLVLLMVVALTASLYLPTFATTTSTGDHPPIITVTGNPTSWVKGSATLNYTIDIQNNHIESFKINDSAVTAAEDLADFTSSILISENKTVKFEVIDDLGSKTTETVDVTYIDNELPKLSITKISSSTGNFGSTLLALYVTDNAGLDEVKINDKVVADITNGAKSYTFTYDTLFGTAYSGIPYGYSSYNNNYMNIVIKDIVGNEYTTYAMIVNDELITPNVPSTYPTYPNYPTFPGSPYLPDPTDPFYFYLMPAFSNGDKPEITSLTEDEVVIKAPEVKNGYSLKYQWQKLNNNTYSNIAGATEVTFKTAPAEGDTYRVLITDYVYMRQLTSAAVTVKDVPVKTEEPPVTEPAEDPISEEDIIITGVPADGKVTQDGMIILVPSPMNGSWIYDEQYFSGSNTGVSVFKAKQAGVTSIGYTAVDKNGNTATKYFIIEILPNKIETPHTCDD